MFAILEYEILGENKEMKLILVFALTADKIQRSFG